MRESWLAQKIHNGDHDADGDDDYDADSAQRGGCLWVFDSSETDKRIDSGRVKTETLTNKKRACQKVYTILNWCTMNNDSLSVNRSLPDLHMELSKEERVFGARWWWWMWCLVNFFIFAVQQSFSFLMVECPHQLRASMATTTTTT